MKTFIALLALLVATSTGFSQIVVHGTIRAADGSVPVLAHAHLGKMHESMQKSKSVQCTKDGSFKISIPSPGIYELRLSAVSHQETTIPLVITEPKKDIGIEATLKADEYDANPDRVIIIGDWNKFAFSGTDTLAPVVKSGKTVFVGTRVATGDTLSYQLLGVAGNHSVNGSHADYYTYDGGGDYRSVLRTKKGETVTITYDPSKMQFKPSKELPSVTFKNDPFLAKTFTLSSAVEQMRNSAFEVPKGGGPVTMSSVKYQAILDHVKKTIDEARASGDVAFTQFAAVTLAGEYNPSFPFSKDDAAMILNTVPANSPYWVLAPREAIALASLVDPALGKAYCTSLESNPERSVRAVAMANALEEAYTTKQTDEARKIYTTLKTEYKDVADIQYEITKFNPDAVVQIGKHVPSFELALLGSASKVSDKSMLGHYYMIDFWATWCGPCVREMPSLHQAYAKFKGKKGFEILSISMDANEAQIAPFQQKKWHMPWLNTFIPGIFEAELAKKFEVAGIPRPILVGPDGTIVAMEEELRGEDLEKTLAKFLGEPN